MAAINGAEYIKRINHLHSEVWIDGEKVNGLISEHASFKGVVKSQAALYDLQYDKKLKEVMTFPSPSTGESVGTSFLLPRTKEDLRQRRLMIQEWAKTNGGMMGRSPDYMNTVLVSLVVSLSIFQENKNCFPDHVLAIYEKAREQDWSFTHTFKNPQVNRSSSQLFNSSEDTVSAKIIERNKKGIVINGAKLLATQGGITDELLVYSTGGMIDKSYSYSFTIPSNTKGVKFICRQPFTQSESTFDSPLGARFEENDALVVFDHVLVPWERVFYYDNISVSDALATKGAYTRLALHQVVSRQVVKVEFILGVAQLLVDTIKSGEYQHVQEKIADIIIALETMRAFLTASEAGAYSHNGYMLPDGNPLQAAITTFPSLYPRLTEILQLLGASGMVTIPAEKDFQSGIKTDLKQYLPSAGNNASDRVKLFRLAWDTSMSAFGSRQILYERYFFGDPVRLKSMLYHSYERKDLMQRVENQFLKADN
ncbi:4-hydroxyphenylacetate 3-monooxygenase, oxygenase component [Alteribacillus sp. HJP-4]|uniref:4-hydroxyphenylacetate 3-monooxygenase, oxygenase component n=1 Tax=Alteribacillus sp. HJP-4 TaxID=2775394 RepID=UPI0035CCF45E